MKPSFLMINFFITTVLSLSALAESERKLKKDCTPLTGEPCFWGKDPQVSFSMISKTKNQRVVVLFHGLSDSPYYMKDVAAIFHAEGYDVIAPALDGHATKSEDLLRVTKGQWLATSEYWLRWAERRWSDVSVGGFSTGGALAIRLAAYESSIRELFLFAPAVKIADPAAKKSCIPFANVFRTGGSWIYSDVPETPVKYNVKSLASVCAVYRLTQDLIDLPTRIRQPIWAAVSSDDKTVDTLAALDFIRASHAPRRNVLLQGSNANAAQLATASAGLQLARGKDVVVGHGEVTLKRNYYWPHKNNEDFRTLEKSLIEHIQRK